MSVLGVGKATEQCTADVCIEYFIQSMTNRRGMFCDNAFVGDVLKQMQEIYYDDSIDYIDVTDIAFSVCGESDFVVIISKTMSLDWLGNEMCIINVYPRGGIDCDDYAILDFNCGSATFTRKAWDTLIEGIENDSKHSFLS